MPCNITSSLSPLAPMLSFGCKGIRNITATPEKITEDAAVVLCNRKWIFIEFKIPTKQKEPGSSDSFCFVAEPGIEPESKV